ncbi:MAG: glycosyltransferase [Planctomycetota bacterium]|nr:MAG: glycosyltransferase [Planctomycetota bacterium]
MVQLPPSLPHLLIAIPVFNDWKSFLRLVSELDKEFPNLSPAIMAIDDGSTEPVPKEEFQNIKLQNIQGLSILHLAKNLGHQRAIAVTLPYILKNYPEIPILIMDGDGEDRPEDASKLYQAHLANPQIVIFAHRTKRSEGFWFRFFYWMYKRLYILATGHRIEFGNFSIIPPAMLRRLASLPELWNHYPSSIIKGKIPFSSIPTERGKRYFGRSKMNLPALVLHGLSSLSVFSDTLGVRAFLATLLISLFALIFMAVVISIRLFTDLAIPGWASYLVSSFTILLVQSIMLSLFFVFIILQGRNYASFIPLRDYHYFILEEEKLL